MIRIAYHLSTILSEALADHYVCEDEMTLLYSRHTSSNETLSGFFPPTEISKKHRGRSVLSTLVLTNEKPNCGCGS